MSVVDCSRQLITPYSTKINLKRQGGYQLFVKPICLGSVILGVPLLNNNGIHNRSFPSFIPII